MSSLFRRCLADTVSTALESHSEEQWVGFDLDRTLASYDEWRGIEHIGEPIEDMISLVKELINEGKRVKIFTSRVASKEGEELRLISSYIEDWCVMHIGKKLEVTAEKDIYCVRIYDDIARQVAPNTGEVVVV